MQRIVVNYLTALATVFSQSGGELIVVPRDTESKVGETTYFNCSTNLQSEDIFWYHGDKYIYTGSVIFEPYNKRFEIDINASNGAHNLVIHSVEPGDAGEYICIDDDGAGRSHSAQLIVLDGDPDCQSNTQPDGVIGQNIFNIPLDEVQLSCNVTYHGNVPPKMEWKKVGENTSIKDNVTSIVASNNRYIYTLKFKGDISLDKSSHVCQTTRSRHDQYNCTSETMKVLYFMGGNTTQVKISRGEKLTCAINNNTFSCTHQWYHGNDTCPLSCGETLTTHSMGEYLCRLKCGIRGREYDFDVLKVTVHEETTTSLPPSTWGNTAAAVLVPIICVALAGLIVSSIVIHKQRKASLENVTLDVIKLLVAQQAFAKTVEQERTNVAEEELELLGKICKIEKETALGEEKAIQGVAILSGKLFLVREESQTLEVYKCDRFTVVRKLPELKDLVAAVDMCSCKRNNCLYIMDKKTDRLRKGVLKIDTKGKLLKYWSTRESAVGYLSATKEGNVIITVQDKRLLLEYSKDGKYLRAVDLKPSGCINPWHAIKLDNDRFIVSHGTLTDPLHRVCLVDEEGKIEKSFGRKIGSAADKLYIPFYLAVGSSGFVVVADLSNNRVLLLNSNLEFEAKFVPKYKQRFRNPRRIYLDETEGLLIVVIAAGDPTDRIPSEEGASTEETEEGDPLTEADDLMNEGGERYVMKKTKMVDVDASKIVEENCRILAFDIKPVLEKYKI